MIQTRSARRGLALLAIPASVALLATGCSSNAGSAGASEPQTITLSYASANTGENSYETLAKNYMASHPGVTIKTNRIALNSYGSTLQTQLQAGNGPDVFYINAGSGQAGSVVPLAKAGQLLEIDKSVAEPVMPNGIGSQYSYNGKYYGIPSASAASGIIFNSDLAKQNGVNLTASSTLEDLIAQCGKVAASGRSILGLAGSVPQNPGILAMEIATSTVYGPTPDWNAKRAKGDVTFANTGGWKTALESIKKLYDAQCFQKGAAGAGFDALTNGSSSGNIFGFFAPSGAAKDIMDAAGGHVKLDILPFPAPSGTTTNLIVSADLGLSGNAKTKSPNLVRDFLAWTVQPAQAKSFAEAQGSIPLGSKSSSDLLPQYQTVSGALSSGSTRPYETIDWPNGQIYDALGTGVTGILTGQKTVDQVLQAMDSAWG